MKCLCCNKNTIKNYCRDCNLFFCDICDRLSKNEQCDHIDHNKQWINYLANLMIDEYQKYIDYLRINGKNI